jgi:hypothetical protein
MHTLSIHFNSMKFEWIPGKNLELKASANRGICFEDIVSAIENGGLLDDIGHLNKRKYPRQRMYVVLVNDYVYGVPYVAAGDGVFLKTAFPSRKLKGIYLEQGWEEN